MTGSKHIMRARARGLQVGYDTEGERLVEVPGRYLRVVPTKNKGRGSIRTTVAIVDEGKTWCRGWSGDQVEALKTVAVLSRETP